MISAANFEKILRASRKHKVAKIILEGNEIREIQFWAPGIGVVPVTDVVHTSGYVQTEELLEVPTDPAVKAFPGIEKALADMPSDDEFRYYHSPIVPAPDPIPQEEQRKVS